MSIKGVSFLNDDRKLGVKGTLTVDKFRFKIYITLLVYLIKETTTFDTNLDHKKIYCSYVILVAG